MWWGVRGSRDCVDVAEDFESFMSSGCGNQIIVGCGVIGGQGSGGNVGYRSEKFCGKIRGRWGNYPACIRLDVRGVRRARAWSLILDK